MTFNVRILNAVNYLHAPKAVVAENDIGIICLQE